MQSDFAHNKVEFDVKVKNRSCLYSWFLENHALPQKQGHIIDLYKEFANTKEIINFNVEELLANSFQVHAFYALSEKDKINFIHRLDFSKKISYSTYINNKPFDVIHPFSQRLFYRFENFSMILFCAEHHPSFLESIKIPNTLGENVWHEFCYAVCYDSNLKNHESTISQVLELLIENFPEGLEQKNINNEKPTDLFDGEKNNYFTTDLQNKITNLYRYHLLNKQLTKKDTLTRSKI